MHSVTWFCQCKGNRVGKTQPLQCLTLNNRYNNDLEVTLSHSHSLLAIPGRTGIWKTGVPEVNLSGNQPRSQGPLRYPSLWSERERKRGPWERDCHGTCERPNNKLCNTPIGHWCWDVTPGHTGERQMLSPLHHPPLCYPYYGHTQGLDPWIPHLNRLSFAKVNTVVAPPNEWPTTATLLKSNLPLNGKNVTTAERFFLHWLVKKRTMADEGTDHGTDNDGDTICDFPRYSCNLTRKRPQLLCIETARHSTWRVLNILKAFLWSNWSEKLLSIFFTVIEWKT